jgi:nucleoside-diphosphate-sugar epimerase
MRVVIIGGSGHVGTYLAPRLVAAGHEVIAISRGRREPYQPHAAWQSVQQIVADRDAEEADVTFGARVRDLQPDVVIDISASRWTALVAGRRCAARSSTVLHCGTIWAWPQRASAHHRGAAARPFGEYGIQKAAIEM